MSDSPGCPVSSLAPDKPFGDLTYGSYLKVPQLLQLQHLLVPGQSHDELLFIIIHQAYELWFKQILHELDTVALLIPRGELREARRLLDRVIAIEKLLVDQIHLLETMTPRDFCHFRQALTPASGFQSIQFREVEFLCGVRDENYLSYLPAGSEEQNRLRARLEAPSLRELVYDLLRSRGFAIPSDVDTHEESLLAGARALLPVYRDIEEHAAVYDLCEALVSHDEWLTFWRFHHVRVVERIIGFKPGTGGSKGVRYLDSTVVKRAFPVLWAARAFLDERELFAGYNGPG